MEYPRTIFISLIAVGIVFSVMIALAVAIHSNLELSNSENLEVVTNLFSGTSWLERVLEKVTY